MRILKRKSGSKEYYYLQHSFRRKGKVITKEKYLGLKIPKKIKDIEDAFKKSIREDINKKLKKIKANFQAEWKKIPSSVKKKELEEISISFTYNTNAIEGSTITLDESREIIHDKIAPNKPLRDVKETEAHSSVFLDMLSHKENITTSLILNWHKGIFGETKSDIAGRFRDYFVRVGDYLAPDWQDISKMMDELVKFVNQKNKVNPVELSARVHYRFEKIHPFGDGNGRIGRLLMNHIL